MTLLAGAARVEITPGPGCRLLGYGLRTKPSRSVHDPLQARALYLGRADPGEPGILVVSADLCLITPSQAASLRERIAGATDLEPAHILVACTHTHAGPETGISEIARGRPAPAHVESLLGGLVEAGRSAREGARPARLRWSRSQVWIGRNRRVREGPLDPEVRALRVDARDGGPIAVLFHHGCHPTVLGHENLEISADWPGVAAARIEQETGAVAPFLLGAHADVDPRTRGLKDLAIRGQSRGLGFEAVEILGREVAEAVLRGLDDPGAAWQEGPVAGTSRELPCLLHLGNLPPREAEARLETRRREIAGLLDLRETELFPRLSRLEDAVRDRVGERPLAELREAVALVRTYIRDKTAPSFVSGGRSLDVEVQLLRIGGTALLALPAELTAAVGLDWKQRAAARGLAGAAVSIGNGWLRYLPHPRDLAHPRAHMHYEVLASLLAPGSCEQLLEAASRLLDGPAGVRSGS